MSENTIHVAKLLVASLLFCLILIACDLGHAEGIDLFDYSLDLESYCHTLAELNRTPVTSIYSKAMQAQSYVVLCRTDGSAPDFQKTEPLMAMQGPDDRYVFTYASRSEAEAAVACLQRQPGVKYAECDSEVSACGSPETLTLRSDGAKCMNLGSYLMLAQKYGTGSRTVAVIDSGVSTHSLLRERMKTYGYDYVDADADPTNDLSGHGTHVAGIVADCTQGTQVWIYPVRVLNKAGSGKLSNIVAAVLEATDARVDVINLSLESFEMSAALDDAIESAVARGITVVVAAGNHACDTSTVCPAHLTGEGIVVVGSVEGSITKCSRADYSNYGESVDLYAFGSNIESCSRSGGYVVQSGTSMAAAHVSAVCALMGLTHPGLSPRDTERWLKSTCRGTELPVLDAASFVPISEGFQLTTICMAVGDVLRLPIAALPSTCRTDIVWSGHDPAVVSLDDAGTLRAKAAGTTELTAHCRGFDDVQLKISVTDSDASTLLLPRATQRIEDEAFFGTEGGHIILPDGIARIGDRAFANCRNLRTIVIPGSASEIGEDILANSEQAIILCTYGSVIQAYAVEYKLQYIALGE